MPSTLILKKAFDTVPHKRLLSKLYGYGIRGSILEWIKDFLSNRQQYVSVNGKESGSIPVTSGVPQGSVLGPILVIYFMINYLPDVVKCICEIFADDTKAYSQVSDDVFHETIQESINAMVEWGDKWLSYFNSDKCKVLHLGKSNPKHPYKMFDGTVLKTLESTECEKDLGVYIDPYLNFN